jgi:hypothetical protein
LPINVPEPSFDYIVTDNSWEEQAMATVRFNNAMYELNRVVTAGANNAMAFIGHDRDAAVQRALANAAVASAQAAAAGKAMEGVNVGGQGWNRFGNINNGVAFVSSSAFEYVSKSLNKSLEYFTEGVSTTKDIHFKIPDIEIKGWKFSLFDAYIHNVGAAKAAATTFKVIGGVTGVFGMGMTVSETLTGQKNWIGEGGLDLIMGAAGFFWPYGTAASAAYFGGKYILEEAGYKFW